MRLRRGLFHSLFLLTLNTLTNYAWQLPSPQGVSMESINMRHLLKWHHHRCPCRTHVYSVQFQGEFELRFLNGTWEDVVGCKQINQTTCDLTVELGSDSDYNIRVRAECGSRISTWAELGRPFNRKETNLTVPAMIVTTMGDALQVMFKDLPLTVAMKVTIWKKGEELKASTYVISGQQNPLQVSPLQEGAVYCIRAQAHLDMHNKSSNTDSQCVSITGPGTAWLKPTAVTVAVVIMVGLVLVLSWSLTTCSLESCHDCLSKEQLPTALWFDWPVERVKLYPEKECCEPLQSVLLIGPPSFRMEQTNEKTID